MLYDPKKQQALFELPVGWEEDWKGMPDFVQDDLEAWHSIKVNFNNRDDLEDFARTIGQKLTENTRSIWFPQAEIWRMVDRRYESAHQVKLKYPVYIISKGRWDSRFTAKSLDTIGVPYSIVIEPQEYDQYASVIDPSKILVLPFSNLGQGSIPARNWVWEHSLKAGAARHWILDDNIKGFFRLHRNLKTPVYDGAIFRAAEDFTDRYENVGQSGFNYFMFAPRKSKGIQPFTRNTRIYSCILNRNDLPHRWRGRYNEDTDLSLRILKDGLCTILFNVFLAGKSQTMTMKGGNTDELYQDDGRLQMAQSLVDQHPDVAKVTIKWGRHQHHVDYRRFRKNKLKLKPDVVIPEGKDDYGMSLRILENV